MRIELEQGKICKNNDHTCLFHYINTCRVPRMMLNTRPIGLVFKQHPRDRQMLMHEKTCVIPIVDDGRRTLHDDHIKRSDTVQIIDSV